jgi:hypothetical protein
MARKKMSYTASYNAQVALSALRGDSTANELAAQHQIHPTLVYNGERRHQSLGYRTPAEVYAAR